MKPLKRKQRNPLLLCLILLTSWIVASGCGTVQIVSSDRVVYPVKANVPFTPTLDGVFMSTALYQRTQKAVADRLLELRTTAPPVTP